MRRNNGSHEPVKIGRSLSEMKAWFEERAQEAAEAATYLCPLCLDTGRWTGYVEKTDGTRILQGDGPCPRCAHGVAEAQLQAQARVTRLFGESQLRERWANARLTDFEPGMREDVESALRGARGIFITGPIGVGKTHLLAAALYSRMVLGETALYITLPQLLTRIRGTFGKDRPAGSPSEDDLIMAAANVRWLGLDDLGVEEPTEWARAELFTVINERYNRNAPLIATSNLSLDHLAQEHILGPRIVSRLREMCVTPITMQGRDRRSPR